MRGDRYGLRGRLVAAAVVLGVVMPGLLFAATSAGAARPAPKILSPSSSRVVVGRTATLRVRGSHLRVSIGSRDLTKRLGRPVEGVRALKLRRGKDFHVGANRIVVATGKGSHRRYVAKVFLAARPAKLLTLRRLHGNLAEVEYKGRSRAKLGRLLVTVNGNRFAQRDLIRDDGRSFLLQLGVGDGLRYGRNRIVLQGVSADGRRVSRLTRTVHISRSAGPLADAGPDRRATVGRPVLLTDGGSTPMHRGDQLDRVWQIVSAPKGSKARLKGAATAHPRIVADVPGRYRVRLAVAEPERRPARPGAAAASAAGPEGVDVMTVEASATDSPLGTTVETLTAHGIAVGGQTYPVESPPSGKDAWVQVLILDRSNLSEVSNQTIPTEYGTHVGFQAVVELSVAVGKATSEDLVILSGGGRQAAGFETSQGASPLAGVQSVLHSIGVAGGPEGDTGALFSGQWSAIGVPGTESGSGTIDFSGAVNGGFANQLPVGLPGSLQGYLHYSPTAADPADSDLGGGYVFLSPDHAPIDTEGQAANEAIVSIEVAGQTYKEFVPQGSSGFDLLLLNHRLESISNHTYVTNTETGSEEKAGVEALLSGLHQLIQGEVQPALVVIQSFGKPGGRSSYWLLDSGIRQFPWGAQSTVESTQLHNEYSAWSQEGFTVAAEIGEIAGPVAHDQIAQLASQPPAPSPSYSGGFTAIVPYGEPSAAYTQSEAGSRLSSARVAGDLVLNHNSNWEVAAPSESTAFSSELLDVVYQAPQQWPDSGTPGFEAADSYIAEQLHLGTTNVRVAYYTDDRDSWEALRSELQEVTFPKGAQGFRKSEFAALKAQLMREFPMVESVQKCIENWERVFTTSKGNGLVDLSQIVSSMESEIHADISQQTAELKSGLVLAHSLGIVAGLAGATGVAAPVAGFFGAISNSLSLASDLSTSKAGSLSALPVKAKASEVGAQLSQRYEAIDESLAQISDILVSDWGKLQAANAQVNNATSGWALSSQIEPTVTQGLSVSASQQAATALMPVAYGEYLVSPVGSKENPNPTNPPWTYTCTNGSFLFPQKIQPLGGTKENPNSWVSGPYELGGNSGVGFTTVSQARVMAIQGNFRFYSTEGEQEERDVEPPFVLGKSLADKLFESPKNGGYGLDQVAFFGDPAFRRWPLYC